MAKSATTTELEIDFEKVIAFKAIRNAALDTPDKLPSRLKVLNWGLNETVVGPVRVDESSAELLKLSQDAKGFAEVALDFEHNTVPGSQEYNRTVEPRAVAAYGTPAIVPDDGIYLENIRWTPEGNRMALNYSDLSPALLTDATGAVTFIHSVALCRNGAVEGLTFHSASAKKPTVKSGQKVKRGPDVIGLEEAEAAFEDRSVNYKDFPAWELVRVEPRFIPRGSSDKPNDLSWPDRWRMCGARLYGGRMIANKLDPVWSKLGDSNEFADAVDSEIPPFAYNSGFGWMEVDRDTCRELGVPTFFRGKHAPKVMPKVDLRNFSAEEAGAFVADINQQWKGNNMENISVEELAPVLGLPANAPKADVLKALAAQRSGQPDLKQLAAPFEEKVIALSAEVKTLKDSQAAAVAASEKVERDNLIQAATKEGKVIPLSAESLAALPLLSLKEMIGNLTPGIVTLTASGAGKQADTKTVIAPIDRVRWANQLAYENLKARK